MHSYYWKALLDIAASSASILVAGVSVLIAILVYRRSGKVSFGNMSIDFRPPKPLATEASESVLLAANKDLDPAERQYLLLKAYHEQSLNQSRVSMWFSLVFAAIGFVVIILAIFQGGEDKLIKVGSGTVIDAVAGLFFVQSNKARELMSTFFDKLRTDRKLDESLSLVNAMPDPELKSRAQLLLSLNFAEVKIDDATLLRILEVSKTSTPTS